MWSIKKVALASLLALLIVQLNIFFAWTSHVGAKGFHGTSPARLFLLEEVSYLTKIQLSIPAFSSYFSNLARGYRFSASSFGLEMRFLVDYEVIALTLAIFLVSLFLFWGRGLGLSILRAFEITSAAVLPLGFEIYSFDNPEFNIHASDIQVRLGLAWFTNADVLYASFGILAVTALIEALRYANRKTVRMDPGMIAISQKNR